MELIQQFNLLASSLGGVAKLRELILSLAVRGKLVPQNPADEPASMLLQKIRAEKERLIAEGKIKKDKPLSPISHEEKPFELPEGWAWVRLNSLLAKIGAGSTPLGGKEVYTPSGIKFLRSQNVWDEGLRLTDVAYIPVETHHKMSGTVVQAKDILFNITGASIGRCALVPDNFDEANVSQHVTIIRPAVTDVRHFLHLVLISRHVQQTVMDVQVGVSREGLSIAKLGQFIVPLPPLPEQSRIVAKVDELMALCDRLEAEQEQAAQVQGHWMEAALAQLADSADANEFARHWQHLAQHFDTLFTTPDSITQLEATLLQLAVRGKLVPQDPSDEPASTLLQKIRTEKDRLLAEGKIKKDKSLPPISDEEKPFALPEGWEWTRLGTTIDLISGQHLGPTEYFSSPKPSAIPYLTGPAEFGTINPEPSRFTLERRAVAVSGDILVTVKGSGVGKTNVVDLAEIAISRQLMAIRPIIAERGFLELVMANLAQKFQAQSVGIAIPGISREDVLEAIFLPPPLPEQSRIVAKVDELFALTYGLKTQLAKAQQTQALLAEALLDEVIA